MSRDEVSKRAGIKAVQERYELWDRVPQRGFMINGKPAMTQIDGDRVGGFVLVVVRDPLINYDGDPAKQVGEKLDAPEIVGQSGMFTSVTGTYQGTRITIVSGGSGSPEAELLLYDFMEHSKAHTYIRVGGSGGIGKDVMPGDIVISSGAVREEAMTKAYIGAAYPAVSHYEVVAALVQSADAHSASFHVGTTLSVDSDFVGVGRPGVGGYMQPWNTECLLTYARAGVLNGDRESAAIITLAALFGFRGGSVCSVADNLINGAEFQQGAGHVKAIDVALDACVELARIDALKVATGKQHWHGRL